MSNPVNCLVSVGLAVWIGGCVAAGGAPVAVNPRPAGVVDDLKDVGRQMFPAAAAAPQPGSQILGVAYQVLRFCVPADGSGIDSRMWDHINEGVVSQDRALVLQRNGLRVGVGRASSWPAVREALLAGGPEIRDHSAAVESGRALAVAMNELAEPESLFHYAADQRLLGASFRPGMLGLRVTADMPLANRAPLRLHAVPELRRPKTALQMRLDRQSGILEMEESEPFEALAFDIILGPDEYLVIGPTPPERSAVMLVGRRLLESSDAGQTFENVYVLAPKIMSSAGADQGDIQHSLGRGHEDERGAQ